MRNTILFILSIGFLFLLTGCPGTGAGSRFKYQNALFPDKATNLTVVNSEFDDYNSALPEVHYGKKLIFSSNRRSHGNDFDIYDGNFHAFWDMETGTLLVDDASDSWIGYSFHSDKLLKAVDNEGEQFAPYAISFDSLINDTLTRVNFLAYSTNHNSYCFQSEFVYYITPDEGKTFKIAGPDTISFLNDIRRQQYISFYGPNINSIDNRELNPDKFTEMYFDKSDNGSSNIYKINIPDTLGFVEFLKSDNQYEKVKISQLCSSSNDRCPFVNGQYMVFASNRPGGYGGYDLYYSHRLCDGWSEPVNFGESINSEYDEFRPVVVNVFNFKNDLMIFSSNRPEGKGGYDLYYVGIDKIAPNMIE